MLCPVLSIVSPAGTIILILGFHKPYAEGGLSQNKAKHLRFRFADKCKGPLSFEIQKSQAAMIGIICSKSSLESEVDFVTEDMTLSIKTSSFFPPNKKNLHRDLELIV